MDLNYLYRREQISLFNADNAACGRSRAVHQSMADAYAVLIAVAKNNDAVTLSRLERQGRTDPGGRDEARGRLQAALTRQNELWLQIGPRPTGATGGLNG